MSDVLDRIEASFSYNDRHCWSSLDLSLTLLRIHTGSFDLVLVLEDWLFFKYFVVRMSCEIFSVSALKICVLCQGQLSHNSKHAYQ